MKINDIIISVVIILFIFWGVFNINLGENNVRNVKLGGDLTENESLIESKNTFKPTENIIIMFDIVKPDKNDEFYVKYYNPNGELIKDTSEDSIKFSENKDNIITKYWEYSPNEKLDINEKYYIEIIKNDNVVKTVYYDIISNGDNNENNIENKETTFKNIKIGKDRKIDSYKLEKENYNFKIWDNKLVISLELYNPKKDDTIYPIIYDNNGNVVYDFQSVEKSITITKKSSEENKLGLYFEYTPEGDLPKGENNYITIFKNDNEIEKIYFNVKGDKTV